MLTKSKLFLPAVLLLAVILAGCELGAPAGTDKGETGPTVITAQTRFENFYAGSDFAADPIVISVTVSNGAGASYQWFTNTTESNRDGTPIEGANGSTYTVTETAAGTYYFYAVVAVTDGDGVKTEITSDPVVVVISATEDKTPDNTVTVNLTKYQYVRGFGGMSTPWENAPDDNPSDFETMFNPNKLGYNISRIMIPPEDVNMEYNMKMFIANETRFSGSEFSETNNLPVRNRDNSDYYENVKTVNKYGGYVLASPWTPPADWKSNGTIVGGPRNTLKTENYLDLAGWLREYGRIMAKNGAPVYAISLQNEFTYPDEKYEGCTYSATQHANWWKQAGDYLDGVKGFGGGREISKVRAMSGESHNAITDLNSVLAADVRGYIDILGRHIYGAGITGTDFKNTAQNHAADPKEIWMSEHNINSQNPPATLNDSTWNYVWAFMNDVDFTIRLNDENAFIWWTAKRFYSMLGDRTNGTTEGAVLPRGHGLSHYAKFAKETGRVGVTVTGSAAGVNPSDYNNNNTGPKITAFVTLKDEFYAEDVENRYKRWKNLGGSYNAPVGLEDVTAISLVMYTPTNNSGQNGTDMRTVKIQLPEGFKIRSATAMRSDNDVKSRYENVTVGTDLKTAYVELPAGTILSVRFTK